MAKVIQTKLSDGSSALFVLEKRYCKCCGYEFQPIKRSHVYCCRQCQKTYSNLNRKDRNRHGGKREKLLKENGFVCSNCGKYGNEFDIVAHHETFDNQNHKYQTLLCRSCHAKEHGLGKKWPTFEIECRECGKKFTTHRWHTKYCSPKCERKNYYWRNREKILAYQKSRREKHKPSPGGVSDAPRYSVIGE